MLLVLAVTCRERDLSRFGLLPKINRAGGLGEGAIKDWLEHCAAVEKGALAIKSSDLQRSESEFEAKVIQALSAHGVKTVAQYPSCGYFIDIVAETEAVRVAIECDGEIWHLDEHGELRLEDVQRQEILERAGLDGDSNSVPCMAG